MWEDTDGRRSIAGQQQPAHRRPSSVRHVVSTGPLRGPEPTSDPESPRHGKRRRAESILRIRIWRIDVGSAPRGPPLEINLPADRMSTTAPLAAVQQDSWRGPRPVVEGARPGPGSRSRSGARRMPVEFAAYAVQQSSWGERLLSLRSLYSALAVATTYLLYRFCQGSRNPYDGVDMHGKVVLVTGGTSGIGAAVVHDLARRGAQVVLLVRSVTDGWTQEYVADLRERTDNDLIFAEACDLSSLASVRRFATTWIDSTPVRRLDQVILCAGVALPMYTDRRTTADGVELHLGVNYLAPRLLLTLLGPCLRAQPAERDVRVVATTCASHLLAETDLRDMEFQGRGYPSARPWRASGASKLLLMTMLVDQQRRLDAFVRPDGLPCRVNCLLVDPGFARTGSLRRWVSMGTLPGLALYLLTYPLWFVLCKSAEGAAQGVLFASMGPTCSADVHHHDDHDDDDGVRGGELYGECTRKPVRRPEVRDPDFQRALWDASETLTREVEVRSALAKKVAEREG